MPRKRPGITLTVLSTTFGAGSKRSGHSIIWRIQIQNASNLLTSFAGQQSTPQRIMRLVLSGLFIMICAQSSLAQIDTVHPEYYNHGDFHGCPVTGSGGD